MYALLVDADGDVVELTAAGPGHLPALSAAHGCAAKVVHYPPEAPRCVVYVAADNGRMLFAPAGGGHHHRPSLPALRYACEWIRMHGDAVAHAPLHADRVPPGLDSSSATSADDVSAWCDGGLNIFSRFLALQALRGPGGEKRDGR